MPERAREIMVASQEDRPEEEEGSGIVLPDSKVEIFGGTIESSLNALLSRHVATAKALDRANRAQHALKETMDRAVILLQDPAKSETEAIKELSSMLDLQKKLSKEQAELQALYAEQEAEHRKIQDEMSVLAKEHPELFMITSEIAAA